MDTLSQKIRLISSFLALALSPMLAAQTSVEFSIGWSDNSSNESGFAVYYSLEAPEVDEHGQAISLADRQELATTAADEATAVLSLPAGQRYWIAVLAFNEFGESGYTNPLALDFTPPDGRPSDLTLDGPVVTTVSGNLRVTGDLIVDGAVLTSDTKIETQNLSWKSPYVNPSRF